MAKEALRNGDWAAVAQAITERMSEVDMSASYLSRETGLSPNTVQALEDPSIIQQQSTLVAVSAVLGWHYDHLTNILQRHPEKNIRRLENSPMEANLANLLRSEIGPMRDNMTELAKTVNGMGKRIDMLFQGRAPRAGTDTSEPT